MSDSGKEKEMMREEKEGPKLPRVRPIGDLHQGPLPPKGRWSKKRKADVVIRMLRGESLDGLSRELGVEIYRLEQWRGKALSGMEASLERRDGDPLQAELDQAMRKIGELSMEVELLRKRCEAKESLRPRRPRR